MVRKPLRCLTVRAPWAVCEARYGKGVENRGWAPSVERLAPGDQLAIHAGQAIDVAEIERAALLARVEPSRLYVACQAAAGAVVALVTYAGAVTSQRDSRCDRRWWIGPIGWVLVDRVALELDRAVRLRGRQGLWTLDDDIADHVRALAADVRRLRPGDYAELDGPSA